MSVNKPSIVTFKAEASLLRSLRSMPNRSAFIRSAILAALDNTCPVCQGTGIMTPEQKTHWEAFAEVHAVAECNECHQPHLVCSHDAQASRHKRSKSHRKRAHE